MPPNQRLRRTSTVRREPQVEFLGGQDGPPERELKRVLTEGFLRRPVIERAYLARIGFAPGMTTSVALCLVSRTGDDPVLVQQIGEQFAAMFAVGVPLDILFVTPEQESELSQVCTAFYVAPA